jgi:hypothetical protein
MSLLFKNPQEISLLIVCVVYLCHMIWSVDAATDRYFFDRDLESRQLRLTYHNTSDMCNDNEDIACLKPQSFPLYSTFVSPIYQILEYEDYLNNHEFILNKTNNSSFTVFDPRNQTWHLVFNGNIKPLEQASDELENVQLSILYYTDVFFDISNAIEYAMAAALSTMIVTVLATVMSFASMIKYRRESTDVIYERSLHNPYLPSFLWMFSSLVFLVTIISRVATKKSKMDEWYIALISTMADWGSSGFIIWTIIREKDITLSRYGVPKEARRLNLPIFELVLLLVPTLAPTFIYAFDARIFGPDDASLVTGYSYINTMTASINEIGLM